MRSGLLAIFGGRAWLPAALLIAVGLSDGLGLSLLMPLLAAAGIAVARTESPVLTALGWAGLPPTLAALAGAYLGLVLLRAALVRWQARTHNELHVGTVVTLRVRLFEALSRASWETVSRIPQATLAHALTAEPERCGMAVWGGLQVGAQGALLLIYAALALWVSPGVTALGLAGATALSLALRSRTSGVRRKGVEVGDRGRALYAQAMTHLAGLKTARSYGAETPAVSVFRALAERLGRSHQRAAAMQADLRFGLELGGALLMVALLLSSRRLGVPVGDLLFLAYLFMRGLPMVSSLQLAYHTYSANVSALHGVLQLDAQLRAAIEPATGPTTPIAIGEGVRLEGVCYRHPGGADRGVEGIDLVIPPRGVTGLVGRSGAGKTTVADLVMGLLRPQRGRVLVGGTPLDAQHVAAWRAQVGYVAQETFLFNGTVRDNLRWARPDADDDAMRRALEQAAAEFVLRLPDGLDTRLGDGGHGLSGGERQRLSLARALLRRPALLVLDEPTTGLDAENAGRVLEALEHLRGQTAILVLSHQAERFADRTYFLEDGRLRLDPRPLAQAQ